MKIITAKWLATTNQLLIECKCGNRFYHNANRWSVECPKCHKEKNLKQLREIRG